MVPASFEEAFGRRCFVITGVLATRCSLFVIVPATFLHAPPSLLTADKCRDRGHSGHELGHEPYNRNSKHYNDL
jgi:hypothetical protein